MSEYKVGEKYRCTGCPGDCDTRLVYRLISIKGDSVRVKVLGDKRSKKFHVTPNEYFREYFIRVASLKDIIKLYADS